MGFGDFIKKVQDKCDEVANSIKASDAVVKLNTEMETAAGEVDKAWLSGMDTWDKKAAETNSNGGLLAAATESTEQPAPVE